MTRGVAARGLAHVGHDDSVRARHCTRSARRPPAGADLATSLARRAMYARGSRANVTEDGDSYRARSEGRRRRASAIRPHGRAQAPDRPRPRDNKRGRACLGPKVRRAAGYEPCQALTSPSASGDMGAPPDASRTWRAESRSRAARDCIRRAHGSPSVVGPRRRRVRIARARSRSTCDSGEVRVGCARRSRGS